MGRNKKKLCLFRKILIVLLFPVIVCWAIYRKIKFRNKNKPNSVDFLNVSQIDNLSGIDFENLLKDIFESEKYQQIRDFLKTEYANNVVYPDMYNIFRCFKIGAN